MAPKKDGKVLQRLVRSIESALGAGRAVNIESPKFFIDRVTGRKREHDVVLTIQHTHHEVVVALECRDRSRPVGVGAVEEFHQKCMDTGINSGIIVSQSGFRSTALKKAAHYNVGCLTLEQVRRFDWCAMAELLHVRRNITKKELYVEFPPGVVVRKEDLLTEKGTPLTVETVDRLAVGTLNASGINVPDSAGDHVVRLIDAAPELFFADVSGLRVKATKAVLTVWYTVTVDTSAFALCNYQDALKSKPISESAVATFPMGTESTADLVLSKNEHGQISIAFVPSKYGDTPAAALSSTADGQ